MLRAFACGGVVCLAACQLNAFDTHVQAETTVPGEEGSSVTLLTAIPFARFDDLDFSQSQDFRNQGVTADQINSAEVTSFTLEILDPANEGFGFLQQVEVYAHAGDDETLVASLDDVDASATKLTLDVTDVDFTSYVDAPKMSLEVRTKGRLPAKETRIQATADVRFRVKVY